jgi:hypothetical protein
LTTYLIDTSCFGILLHFAASTFSGQKKTFLDILRLFWTDDEPVASPEFETAAETQTTRRGGGGYRLKEQQSLAKPKHT